MRNRNNDLMIYFWVLVFMITMGFYALEVDERLNKVELELELKQNKDE